MALLNARYSPRPLIWVPTIFSVEVLPVPAPASTTRSTPETQASMMAPCSSVGLSPPMGGRRLAAGVGLLLDDAGAAGAGSGIAARAARRGCSAGAVAGTGSTAPPAFSNQ